MLRSQLGSMCHSTLGGPVNNGFSQEQLVVTWNSKRRPCICVCTCIRWCDTERQRETGPSTIWRCETIPDEAENLEPFLSACRFLDQSVFSRRVWTSPGHHRPSCPSKLPVMARTNSDRVKWAITRCATPSLKVDWPKTRSAGQVKFIYRSTSTNSLKPFVENNTSVCACVFICVFLHLQHIEYQNT